jgi:hypothetical protein
MQPQQRPKLHLLVGLGLVCALLWVYNNHALDGGAVEVSLPVSSAHLHPSSDLWPGRSFGVPPTDETVGCSRSQPSPAAATVSRDAVFAAAVEEWLLRNNRNPEVGFGLVCDRAVGCQPVCWLGF